VTSPVAEDPSAAEEALLDCRHLYRALAASVTVITAQGDSGPQGMTASSVTAVSLTPPLMAVTLAPHSQTLAALRTSGRFVINVLGEDQQALSARFAGPRPGWARFAGITIRDGELPKLVDALASAVCTVEWERACGDRVLVLGRVQETEVQEGSPLLWHGSGYHGLRPAAGCSSRG
jgi:flavin reductase (DIM6/NTAB) family NADH-FMN oxidoreductase RutF